MTSAILQIMYRLLALDVGGNNARVDPSQMQLFSFSIKETSSFFIRVVFSKNE